MSTDVIRQMKSIQLCEKGPRPINQDAVYVKESGKFAVYVVADGMGGHQSGEKASKAVADAVAAWCVKPAIKKIIRDGEVQKLLDSMETDLQEANTFVFNQENNGGNVCGATMVLMMVLGDAYGLLSIGDSRGYQLIEDELEQLTPDDVWENDASRTRGLSDKEICASPRRGQLLKAFGTEPVLELHRMTGRLPEKSVFMLCSDGVYKYLPEEQLALWLGQMRDGKSMKSVMSDLEQSLIMTGKDNYSAVFVRTEKTGIYEMFKRGMQMFRPAASASNDG